ncbi:TadE/TadG family type IV pilus assembly protein [Actinopolymorpha pittospori]|uniref:Flp pilus assembly protein TadG n=1 Tax=Actinopolymorpha pittospori TaxID=648752 RepID=A0A927RMC9_9ACTN|nr:TadE family protein [Actinopolymorpha pittospori]MBE1610066.1 Flp pilus assembly protein TadG [Actinopolymorpha pittospori]
MIARPALALRRLAQRVVARRERGSSTIQLVVLLPALFSLMFLGVQAAVMYQGRTIALAAAQEGAREAAGEQGTAASGISAAHTFVSSTTAGLKGTSVSGYRNADEARITVTTHTVSVIPAWKPTITQSASMPVEKVTTG